jgi:hypothetical protein
MKYRLTRSLAKPRRIVTSRSLLTAPLEAAVHLAWDATGPHLRQAIVPFVNALVQRDPGAPPLPRHPTIDALIANGRMNPRQQPAFVAAADVRVDGVRLGKIPPVMLTTSPNEFRYDKTTLETRLLAHALTAAGFRAFDGTKRERPDFRVTLADGRTVHVEVAEVHEPTSAEWTNNTARIHIEANDALDADSEQQKKLIGTQLEFRVRTLPTSAQARSIAREIGRFIAAGTFASIPERTLATVGAAYPQMAAHLSVYRAPLRGPRGHLAVQADAHSFDGLGLVPVAEKVLARKRELKYDVQPQWLVLGVTDGRGSFGASMNYFAQHPPAIVPFERVFIHYEGRVLILGRDGLVAQSVAA